MDKLLVIIGPTAVGKTDLSIELAKELNGEIISGDSMQIYKGMDIGTAKVTTEEMKGVPHHLIDIRNPDEAYSAADFQSEVKKLIRELNSKGKLPIIVGGTGLYIQSVLYDYQFSEVTSDPKYREHLEQLAYQNGNEYVYNMLKEVNSESAKTIHPNNIRRVIRALEIYHHTGQSITEYQQNQKHESPYNHVLIGLTMDRTELYSRINLRVDLMVKAGLLEEVSRLYEKGYKDTQAFQAIGYKELAEYCEGLATREEAIEKLKRNSRRYAKRQLTWFRNKMDVSWFDVTKKDRKQVSQEILRFVAGKLS